MAVRRCGSSAPTTFRLSATCCVPGSPSADRAISGSWAGWPGMPSRSSATTRSMTSMSSCVQARDSRTQSAADRKPGGLPAGVRGPEPHATGEKRLRDVTTSLVIVDWPQEPREHPPGDARTLPSRILVSKAEVNAEPHPGVDHFVRRIREATIHARVRADGYRGRCGFVDLEVQSVCPEEQLQGGDHRGRESIGTGRVVRIRRRLGSCRESGHSR